MFCKQNYFDSSSIAIWRYGFVVFNLPPAPGFLASPFQDAPIYPLVPSLIRYLKVKLQNMKMRYVETIEDDMFVWDIIYEVINWYIVCICGWFWVVKRWKKTWQIMGIWIYKLFYLWLMTAKKLLQTCGFCDCISIIFWCAFFAPVLLNFVSSVFSHSTLYSARSLKLYFPEIFRFGNIFTIFPFLVYIAYIAHIVVFSIHNDISIFS